MPGTPTVCTTADQCHVAGSCDSSTGVCSNSPAASGTPCNDGSVCTQTDACDGSGDCRGAAPLNCDDGDNCTADSCDPTNGCVHVPTPRSLGNAGGCTPPTAGSAKCEESVEKTLATLVKCVGKCHARAATLALQGVAFSEEDCESTPGAVPPSCLDKFNRLQGQRLAKGICPVCLGKAAQVALAGEAEAAAEGESGEVFCAGSTPLDGDDAGLVPPNKSIGACEAGVTHNLGELYAAVGKCLVRDVGAKIKGRSFDVQSCQTIAVGHFDVANRKLSQCPLCLTEVLPTLGVATAAGVSALNPQIYCASPSGAFVEDSGLASQVTGEMSTRQRQR